MFLIIYAKEGPSTEPSCDDPDHHYIQNFFITRSDIREMCVKVLWRELVFFATAWII